MFFLLFCIFVIRYSLLVIGYWFLPYEARAKREEARGDRYWLFGHGLLVSDH